MDLFVLIASGVFIAVVALTLIAKRKSIKAYFAKLEEKKQWAIKRSEFVNEMNKAVNPFTGYQMITYKIDGRRNTTAKLNYKIPLEDLNNTSKWNNFVSKEMNQFIDTLRTHEFKNLEVTDCNGSKRTMKL